MKTAIKTNTEIEANKYILVTTEKERKDAGVWMDVFFNLDTAKSRKHINAYKAKIQTYTNLIQKDNKNWIEILIKSKGVYRYKVEADCVIGFDRVHEVRFKPDTSVRVGEWLKNVKHKTTCSFYPGSNNAILDVSLTTWEDAVAFANFLSDLDLSNYMMVDCAA